MIAKRFTLFFIAALLTTLSLFAHDFEVNGIYYNKNSDGTSVSVTYKGSNCDSYPNEYSGKVVIPSEVTYNGKTYSVTSIGEWAFSSCSRLTSITIPNSVTSIGYGAFRGCKFLIKSAYPNHLTTPFESGIAIAYPSDGIIDGNGVIYDKNKNTIYFAPLNISSVTIGNSVTSIGDYAFYGCSGLTSVTIPNSVTSIGGSAFEDCSGLTSVTIPNSVTSIRDYAFMGCSGLTSVTIHNSVTSIANDAFLWCYGLIKSAYPYHLTNPFESGIKIAYPSDGIIDENGVIYDKNKNTVYFAPLNISSFSIPNSVTSIGNSAFSDCRDLQSIELPNSITTIENSVFNNCSSLKSVIIPNSVRTIGHTAFYNCNNLEAIIIPKSVTSIGDDAFYGCSKANCLYLIEDSYLASKVTPCKSRYGAPIVCKQKGYENWVQFVNYTVNGNNITLSGNGCTLTSATMNNVTFEAIDNEININNYSAGTNNPLMIKGTFFDCDFETEISLFDIEYEITKQTYNNVWLTTKVISNYTKYNAEYKFENENVTGGVDFYIPASVLGLSEDYFVARISEINPEIDINDIFVKPNAISLKGTYKYLEDATYTVSWFQEDVIGSEAVFMGLTPNTTYTYDFSFETEEDGTFTVRKDFTTPSLTFDVLPAQVVNERKVLIRANTNGVDDALRFGFEWRRYDAPEEMPSTKSPCPVVEGVMYGALNNLSANTYYKFRPYYKSDDGNIFYGDWVAFYSGDAAAYFEPMVYTSGATEVRADVAQVKGVVVAGSDEILEQGFEYWDSANSGNKQTATSSGTLMNVELRNLTPKTTYYYRAYAKTIKGNTYGTELSFTTEASAGIDEVYAEGENITILGYYNLQGLRFDEPQNGLNIILYSNGMTKKLYIRK